MEGDPFLQNFDSSELKIAEEFLTSWLPFLTRGLCDGCAAVVRDRIQSLGSADEPDLSDHEESEAEGVVKSERSVVGIGELDSSDEDHVRGLPSGYEDVEPTGWDTDPAQESPKVRMSWADMAQQDELEEEEEEDAKRISLEGGMKETKEEVKGKKPELSREQRERIRFTNVGRKKDFVCLERVDGRIVNILDGLELHSGVFSVAEQKKIVGFVYELQERGKNKELGEHTYSEPRKWMRGKGRVTIQFGCCYNYEKKGIPPGILRDVVADPIPNLFKVMIKRLIGWHVMPTSCVPDSCIINIYEPGDCIPPHIDSHDFVRPFCTVSFLSECNIVFGTNLKVAGAGEFTGSTAVALPVGSVLVLNGNGADVAKHCVPAVPLKRISITFRKMDKNKWPLGFELEPDLQNIQPYDSGSGAYSQKQIKKAEHVVEIRTLRRGRKSSGRSNRPKGRWDSMRNRAAFPVQANFMKRSSYPSTSSDSDEAEESVERSLHRGGIDEEGGSSDGNVVSNGRRVRVEQRRIIVTRNLDLEDDSLSTRIHNHDHPQVHIRTIKNNQRRLQVHK
ncbi:alkylated DNA repair protein alkB like 5 [Apostasia shenzhenica]|uniref:Alkylated DNA repair protein alkB like 5 n=1 Tax=Apostasia shenzhenica TaxID=1088818 RepID=A0A2I0APF7_9ASPA|nr:alkylated DNA repair protein alkB like 5 [Apostasia shenzhenica]